MLRELAKAQLRRKSQREVLESSQKAFDAAFKNNLKSMMVISTAAMKRQKISLAITDALILELEFAIEGYKDPNQIDILAPPVVPAEPPSPSRRR